MIFGVKSWRCDRCQEVFYDTKLWQRHKAQKDCSFEPLPSKATKPKMPYKLRFYACKYCQETFKSVKLLKAHKKTHKPMDMEEPEEEEPHYTFDEVQDLYICSVCSAEFQDESEAKDHIMTHREIIVCNVCNENFKNYYDLGMHSITHDPEHKVRCPLCSYVSTNHYTFKAHVNFVHLKKFPFYCKQCDRGFKYYKTYQEHQNTHVGKKPYVCIVCQKCFSYQKYLKIHQVRNHQVGTTGKKIENECRTCNRYFYKPEALEEHVDICYKRQKKPKSQTPAKAFLCDICGQTFTEKAKLVEHLRVHKGDLPYVCSWCGKRFPVKSYLKTHERVHTGEKPYSCEFCGKRFGQQAPFRVHRRLHTGERPYVCEFCNKGYTTNQALKLHKKNCDCLEVDKTNMEKVTLNRVKTKKTNVFPQDPIFGYMLAILNKSRRSTRQTRKRKPSASDSDYIDTRDNLEVKMKRTKENHPTVWKCDKCQTSFKSKIPWQKHQALNDCNLISNTIKKTIMKPKRIKRETVQKTWPCKYCKETFPNQSLLRAHKKSHKAGDFKDEEDPSYKFDIIQDLYICEMCSAEFQNIDEVQEHIKTHVPNLKCGECEELFKSALDLGMHSIKHSQDKKIKCPFCKYVSKSFNPYSFKSHLNYMHLKKFPFYCKECGKGFKQFKLYQEHQNFHTGKRPYVCVVCNKGFTYEKYLIVHQARNHRVSSTNGNNENECKRCHRVFKKTDLLNEHIESCFTKRKNSKKPNSFLCDTCGQGFIEKSKLLKHIRVHNGDLPFACSWCDKRFPQKDYLKTHERVHTGEKPYSCEFCGKCFGFHAPFRVHIRTHTGERPYKCVFCNKGFTTNQGLKLHNKNCPETQVKNDYFKLESSGHV